MNMSKSRGIQAKMPSPKVIFYAFWLVTVKVLNSYAENKNGRLTVNKKYRTIKRTSVLIHMEKPQKMCGAG